MRTLLVALVLASTTALAQSPAAGIYGQTGVKRVTSAQIGPGLFHLGGAGRGFFTGDFIAPGVADENIYLGGNVFAGARLFSLLELSLAAQVGANSNTLDDPSTRFTAGDLFPSLKLAYAAGPTAFGLDVRGILPTAQDAAGVDLGNAGVAGTGLFTLDLTESAFVRVHANAGYVFQLGKGDPNQYLLQGLSGHLLALAAQQWFYDQALYGVAVEVPLPWVTPYVELYGQTALFVPAGAGPGGGDYTPFVDGHLTVSPGVRITPSDTLAIDVGVDVGVLGSAVDIGGLTAGQPVNPGYTVHLGIAYSFDPFGAPSASPSRSRGGPALGAVVGCLKDATNGDGVVGAVVDLGDDDASDLVTDGGGCFRSYPLPVGERAVKITHPDYAPGSGTINIERDAKMEMNLSLTPLVKRGKLAGSVKTLKGEDAEVELVISRGDEVVSTQKVTGAFELELKPGDYQVVLKSEKYLQQGAPVLVLPDQTATREFVVKPIPKKRLSKVEKGKITIKIKIPFALGQATLLKAAEFVLDEVVDRILANSQIKKVRVEGHTDNRGKKDYNQTLSEERAQAVVSYLVEKGVPAARLEAKGFGSSQPVASNRNDRGRAKNRRVVFTIIDEGAE